MRVLAILLFAVALAADAEESSCLKNEYGEVVCGRGQCAADQYKKVWCAAPGGGAVKDKYGEVVCGTGYCAIDDQSQVWCSTKSGGGAAVDSYKKVKCLDGCELASAGKCEAAK